MALTDVARERLGSTEAGIIGQGIPARALATKPCLGCLRLCLARWLVGQGRGGARANRP